MMQNCVKNWDFGEPHFIIRQNGQVQDGHNGEELFLEFLIDGVVKVVFCKVSSVLAIRFGDLGSGRIGRMDRCIYRMNGRIKHNADIGKVVSGQHDDGEMNVSTTAMSRVNGTGIGVLVELALEDLQGSVGGLAGSKGCKDQVGEHKCWRGGSQETHGRMSMALWQYGDQRETMTEVAPEECSTGGGSGRRVEREDGPTSLVTTG
jgi:hypothetical protein